MLNSYSATLGVGASAHICTQEDIRHFFAKDFAAHVWNCLECRSDPDCSLEKASYCVSQHQVPSVEGATASMTDVYRIGDYVNPHDSSAFGVAMTRSFRTTVNGGIIVPDYKRPLTTNDASKVPKDAVFTSLTAPCADIALQIYSAGLNEACEGSLEKCRRGLRSYKSEEKADGQVVDTSLLDVELISKIHREIDTATEIGKEFCVVYGENGQTVELQGLSTLKPQFVEALDFGVPWSENDACDVQGSGVKLASLAKALREEFGTTAEKRTAVKDDVASRVPPPPVVVPKDNVEYYEKTFIPGSWEEAQASADLEGLLSAMDAVRVRIDELSSKKGELEGKVKTIEEERKAQADLDGLKTDDAKLEALSKRVRGFIDKYSDSVLYRRTLRITGNTAYYYQRGLYKDDDCDALPSAVTSFAASVWRRLAADDDAAKPNVEKTKEGCLQRRGEFETYEKGLVELTNFLKEGDREAIQLNRSLNDYVKEVNASGASADEKAKKVRMVDDMKKFVPTQYQVEGTKKVNQWQNDVHEAARLQLEREGFQRREQKSNEVWEDALQKLNAMILENEKAALEIEKQMAEADAQQQKVQTEIDSAKQKMIELQATIDDQLARIQKLQELNSDPQIMKTFVYTGATIAAVAGLFGLYMVVKNKVHKARF